MRNYEELAVSFANSSWTISRKTRSAAAGTAQLSGPRSRNDDAGTGDPAALQIAVSGDDVVEPVGATRADIEDASLNCIEQVRSRSFQLRAMLCVDGPNRPGHVVSNATLFANAG
jgi:hypothetical protein